MGIGKSYISNPKIREAFKQCVVNAIEFAPPAADDDYFKTSTALAADTTTLAAASMTKSVAPYYPVCPVLVITNDVATGETAWTSVSAELTGVDQFGQTITETVAGVDSNTWTCTFTQAFCSLVSITFTKTGGTAADSSDTYILGFAKTYGLGQSIARSGDVLISNFNGAADAGTISVTKNTYAIAGTPDGSKLLNLYVRSTAPSRG